MFVNRTLVAMLDATVGSEKIGIVLEGKKGRARER
jgi:hypothetical protein